MQPQALWKANWAWQLRVGTSREEYAPADKHNWPFIMIASKARDPGKITKGKLYHISEWMYTFIRECKLKCSFLSLEGFNYFPVLHNFVLVTSVTHIQIVSFATIYTPLSMGAQYLSVLKACRQGTCLSCSVLYSQTSTCLQRTVTW